MCTCMCGSRTGASNESVCVTTAHGEYTDFTVATLLVGTVAYFTIALSQVFVVSTCGLLEMYP